MTSETAWEGSHNLQMVKVCQQRRTTLLKNKNKKSKIYIIIWKHFVLMHNCFDRHLESVHFVLDFLLYFEAN